MSEQARFRDQVAGWYFRLNGFLLVSRVVIHPPAGSGSQKTDLDLVGVRFPYRQEEEMEDEEILRIKDKPYIIFVEVKRGMANLNLPWTDPSKGNVQRFLRFVGSFPENEIPYIANNLYRDGVYDDRRARCSFTMIGDRLTSEKKNRWPKVPYISWDRIVSFIHNRFTTSIAVKTDHFQWDCTGKQLYSLADNHRDAEAFRLQIRKRLGF